MATDTTLPPRFRDARQIGRGGMGDIVLAIDTRLDRPVVIKLLADRFAEDESIRKRFTREALAAARLSDAPNTVTIFDVGEAGGRPFIVMEYLPGGSLEERLQSGPVEPEQALEWLEQAALALDAAHDRGVVHRDVKPGNLLLDGDGHVHVADFGVARAAGLDSLTMAGTVLGTAGYLSPEQARGEMAEAASDRYALAVVGFELLTGRRPFQRDTTAAEAAAHVHEPVPSIHEQNPSLAPALDRCFRRALAKEPDDRFPTCVALVAALREAMRPGSASTVTRVAPPAAPVRRTRHPWRMPAAVSLLAAAAIVGALLAAALVGGDGEEARAPTSPPTQPQAQPPPPPPEPPPPAPPPPPPPATTAPPPPAEGSGKELTDQSTALMRAGSFEEALPIAQAALAKLKNSGDIYEAYANYNVGRSLIELGRCDEGLPHIAESERIQGPRPEFGEARAKCSDDD